VLARIERQVTVSKVRSALRESEAKFRSVMESAIDAIVSGDAEGLIRSWNSAAAALFGFTEEEVLGRPIEIIIPERYREQHRQGVQRVSAGGESRVIGSTVELAAIRKDGSEFPVELSLATWVLDDRRYYTGIIRDITERKQAEQKFRSVTDSAIDAIISADHTGVIVSWNMAATRILGYTEEDAVGQALELIIPERFHEAHRNGMARFTATGEGRVIGTTVELSARRRDGEEVPIELSLSTWTVRDARYYTGIIRDIGERKRAEHALRASEQALREKSDELERKNRTLEETLDQLKETQDQLLIQEKMASLGRLSAGMAHELNNPASAVRRGAGQLGGIFERLQEIELRFAELQLSAEQVRRVAELDAVTRERAGSPSGLSAVDRSDRETEIEEWLEDRGIDPPADLAPALVSLGYASSDLKAFADVFDGPAFEAVVNRVGYWYEILELAGELRGGADRIVEMVNALKTYTHLDRAAIKPIDLTEGLDTTLTILRGKLRDGVTVEREYADDLPSIPAHAGELNQVWTNLIDNAIDSMGGRGKLTLKTWRQDPWVIVEIEDDGPGLTAEHRSRVFDPFFTTKSQGEGTGLGLTISRNLVVKHGGEISVTSKPGRTVFRVRLPIAERAAE
jgi:PAS domain S-box-containing protein